MECTGGFKFGMMIHYYISHSFVYSLMPTDLDVIISGIMHLALIAGKVILWSFS